MSKVIKCMERSQTLGEISILFFEYSDSWDTTGNVYIGVTEVRSYRNQKSAGAISKQPAVRVEDLPTRNLQFGALWHNRTL